MIFVDIWVFYRTTEIFAQVKEVLTVDEDAEGNSGLESYLSTGDSSASHSNT